MFSVVKKYLYFIKIRSLRFLEVASRRIKSGYKKIGDIRYEYDKPEKLPFPAGWESLMKFEKLYLEIGSGHGELINHLASLNPSSFYVGFEWAKQFARKSIRRNETLKNVRIYSGDGYRDIAYLFEPESIDGTYILFPDPWHKKKHNKRRPINANFFMNATRVLKKDAEILVGTDWIEYYEYIMNETKNEAVQQNFEISSGEYEPEKFGLPITHYYKKWLRLGKKEFKFILLKFRGRP